MLRTLSVPSRHIGTGVKVRVSTSFSWSLPHWLSQAWATRSVAGSSAALSTAAVSTRCHFKALHHTLTHLDTL